MTKLFKKICQDNSGATAVEYGLIAALIVIAMIGSLNIFASSNNSMWGSVVTAVSNAMG